MIINNNKDYSFLTNKPSINGHELIGNITSEELEISYDALNNKPSINSVELSNKTYQCEIDDDNVNEYIKQQYNDIHVIPDKYNTGLSDKANCNIILEPNIPYSEYGGIIFRSDGANSLYIDFNRPPNNKIEGIITIKNVNFSKYNERNGHGNLTTGYQGTGVKIIYENCLFSLFTMTGSNNLVKTVFKNCSFLHLSGDRMELHHCYVGGDSKGQDGCNCGKYSYLYDCYISDLSHKSEQQGTGHLDGTQSLSAEDILFQNCRWEVPSINYSTTYGGWSYAVYLEPYNGNIGKNCILDHCFINGGGNFSISCTADEGWNRNMRIINPFIGYCYYTGPLYPSRNTSNIIENARLHDSLYVSSVWKDDTNKLHFIVTNDTPEERTLTVITNLKKYNFVIPRTYNANEYEADTKNFSDLPIDIEKIIPENVDYAIFYENKKQIRFINYTKFKIRTPDFVKENSTNYEEINNPIQLLKANTLYKFTDPMTDLTITLEETSEVPIYHFIFTTSPSGCNLSIPIEIHWDGEKAPELKPNTKYEVSILDNIAIISGGIAL